MSNSADVLDGIDEVGSARYPFLTNGDYTELELKGLRSGFSASNNKYFQATVQVKASSGVEALKPGTMASIRIEASPDPKKKNFFGRDVKNLMAAVLGIPAEAVTASKIREVTPEVIAELKPKFQARRGFFEGNEGRVSVWTQYAAAGEPLPPSASAPPDKTTTTTQKRK